MLDYRSVAVKLQVGLGLQLNVDRFPPSMCAAGAIATSPEACPVATKHQGRTAENNKRTYPPEN